MDSTIKDSAIAEKGSTGHNPTTIPPPPPPPPTLQLQKFETIVQLLILAGVVYLSVLFSSRRNISIPNSSRL